MYAIYVDGNIYDPDELLHFVINPDAAYPWKGRGYRAALKDVANGLKQASATKKGFMESKWKPSVIVKVDSMTEELSSKEGRKEILRDYVENTDEEGIHTVYIIGKAVLGSVEVIPVNFYVDDEDVEEDFDDDAAFPESDDVEVKVINETKENQEKEDDTEETEDVLEGIEIEDDSDVDKTETINLEEI